MVAHSIAAFTSLACQPLPCHFPVPELIAAMTPIDLLIQCLKREYIHELLAAKTSTRKPYELGRVVTPQAVTMPFLSGVAAQLSP